jgi:hypothetical protein
MLFRNNPHAAGEQNRYDLLKKLKEDKKSPLQPPSSPSELKEKQRKLSPTSFDDFHVGIVSSSNQNRKKSDKLRALLSFICQHVEVGPGCPCAQPPDHSQFSVFVIVCLYVSSHSHYARCCHTLCS